MSRRRGTRAFVALLSVIAAVAVVLSGGCGDEDLVFPGGSGTPTGTTTANATSTPTGTLTATPRATNTTRPTGTPGTTPSGTTTPIVVPTVCSNSGGPCSEPILRCCTGICLPAPLSICLG